MPSGARVLFVVGLIFVAGTASAQPRYTSTGGTPLDRHRESAATRPPAPVIEGRVALVQPDAIVTSVSAADLLAHDLGDGDRVSVEIGGRVLAARIMSLPTYRALLGDPKIADGLDVDIIGVIDDRGQGEGRLVVLALGGGIGEWLGVRPGTSVVLRVPR